jgi:stress response protein YsnF
MTPGDSVDGATIGEDSIEVGLMQDKVVVDKDVVGVEKVHLATEKITDQQAVTEQVRKEQIEVTGGARDNKDDRK